jgi:hypothetical protein
MRTVLGAILFVLAGAAILPGILILSNIWDANADSSNSAYVDVAAIYFGVALVLVIGGVLALRRRKPSERTAGRNAPHRGQCAV